MCYCLYSTDNRNSTGDSRSSSGPEICDFLIGFFLLVRGGVRLTGED